MDITSSSCPTDPCIVSCRLEFVLDAMCEFGLRCACMRLQVGGGSRRDGVSGSHRGDGETSRRGDEVEQIAVVGVVRCAGVRLRRRDWLTHLHVVRHLLSRWAGGTRRDPPLRLQPARSRLESVASTREAHARRECTRVYGLLRCRCSAFRLQWRLSASPRWPPVTQSTAAMTERGSELHHTRTRPTCINPRAPFPSSPSSPALASPRACSPPSPHRRVAHV